MFSRREAGGRGGLGLAISQAFVEAHGERIDLRLWRPEGATAVFSAHGVAPSVHENAATRELRVIDATCPLVTKVHREAVKFAAEDYTIIMIGHEAHEKVEGTMGEAPDNIVLVPERGGGRDARDRRSGAGRIHLADDL